MWGLCKNDSVSSRWDVFLKFARETEKKTSSERQKPSETEETMSLADKKQITTCVEGVSVRGWSQHHCVLSRLPKKDREELARWWNRPCSRQRCQGRLCGRLARALGILGCPKKAVRERLTGEAGQGIAPDTATGKQEHKARVMTGLAKPHMAPEMWPPSLLDVGCGPGDYLHAARKVLGLCTRKAVGLELNSGSFPKGTGASIRYYDGGVFPFSEEETFGLVTVVNVYHHVPSEKREKFMSEVARVLKPGGIVVFQEHDASDDETLVALQVVHAWYAVAENWSPDSSTTEVIGDFVSFETLKAHTASAGLQFVTERRGAPHLGNVYSAFRKTVSSSRNSSVVLRPHSGASESRSPSSRSETRFSAGRSCGASWAF